MEDFENLLCIKNWIFVGVSCCRIQVSFICSSCEIDSDFSLDHDLCTSILVSKMRPSNNWFTGGDKLEGSSKTTVTTTNFESRMSQELNLRDPRSNPEVGIVIIWGFEVSDTPDNFDSKLFEAVEKCVDAPLLPFAN